MGSAAGVDRPDDRGLEWGGTFAETGIPTKTTTSNTRCQCNPGSSSIEANKS